MQQAIYKVPEGKLIKIFLEQEEGNIKSIKITGDFFIYPEEKIGALESALLGEGLVEDKLIAKLKQQEDRCGLEMFGVDMESIVKTILMAANS
jgi:lipoate---protein ligase